MAAEIEQSLKHIEALIGAKVELSITSGLYKGNYPSRLEEVEGDQVGVSHPMVKRNVLPVHRGTELQLKVETNDCFYEATASIVRNTRNEAVPLLWVKPITSFEKIQRRMFVRVPCSIQGQAFFLSYERDLPDGAPSPTFPPPHWFPVRVADMSLGGMGISIKKNFAAAYCLEGSRYLVSLTIGGTAFFVAGNLVKIFRTTETTIEVGLSYEGLTAFVERLMGSFIRQQELAARG
jgi:c-di-GMP-binding flagellar brake protein YcgR